MRGLLSKPHAVPKLAVLTEPLPVAFGFEPRLITGLKAADGNTVPRDAQQPPDQVAVLGKPFPNKRGPEL